MNWVTKGNYTLPDVYEPNGDKYDIIVWFEAPEFMTYDPSKRDIEFKNMQAGKYKIVILLKDEFQAYEKYEIDVIIKEKQ